ncbi:MAG: DUF4034 domain-containing protein [Phycisphaerales bacterium]|nr:DUF4034 domain-containing protein [Phycisphaerales bacterium]
METGLSKVRDPDDYSFLVGCLANAYEDSPNELDAWVHASPRVGIANTVRGAAWVLRAWKSRSGMKASMVSRHRWVKFEKALVQAQDDLFYAAEARAQDAEPVAWLIPCAMGLPFEDNAEEAKNRHLGAMQRCPGHTKACRSILTAMCEKWLGSHERMFACANYVISITPEGHPARSVILQAHIERALYMESWENDEEGAKAYLRRPEVAQEIASCANEIESSRHIAKLKNRIEHHSLAALCLWKAGLYASARRHFDATNRYLPDDAWGYELSPRRTWRNAHRECQRKGG